MPWLGILQNKYPQLMAKIKNRLENYYVPVTEEKSRAAKGSYWYRPYQPDDPNINGTALTYYATLTTVTEEGVHEDVSAANYITVPTANAYVMFGWYLDADLGNAGYLRTTKQDVTKSEVPARLVYQQKNPDHILLDFDHVIFGQEQDKIQFIIYNGQTFDQICFALPIMFRIASRAALNLELPP